MIYTMEYYSAIRSDEYPTFVSTWIGLEEIMLSEINQAEKVSYHMVSLNLWNIKNNMEDIRRRKGKMKGAESEGERNHERLWTRESKGEF